MQIRHLLAFASLAAILAGCSSTPGGRYDIDDDVAPNEPISVDHIEDAQPQFEPYSLGGNKNSRSLHLNDRPSTKLIHAEQ